MQKLQQERKEKGDKTPVEDIYTTFNLIMRRKPKENNFKAVLETIRDLMNGKLAVPKWLKDVFLGTFNSNFLTQQSKEMQSKKNNKECACFVW